MQVPQERPTNSGRLAWAQLAPGDQSHAQSILQGLLDFVDLLWGC
jgi:hypothetical protein